ncbi:MAG: FAD-dependent oxidoreductase, partial [Acidobacteria bacterium]|nr:FAD-dependent oxidoreductase [Acidobacteriota bacterium]
MSRITRRDFLNQTAVSLAGAGLAGTSELGASQGPTASRPDADIIVVGAGLAGLAAAITAADAGASVLLVDKHYKIGGSAMGAGGSFSAAGSKAQRAKVIEDSPERHFQDANVIGKGKADPALLKLYTEQAAPTQEWLESLGIEFAPTGPRMAPEHELYSTARTCDAKGGGPGYIVAMGKELDRRIAAGKITLKGETAAKRLVTRGGRVVGVTVATELGTERSFHGKAVILACGGYGSNA